MEYLSNTAVPLVHVEVINSVIANSHVLFQEEGCGEDVLMQLKDIWERKLLEKNTIPIAAPSLLSAKKCKAHGKSSHVKGHVFAKVRSTQKHNQEPLATTLKTPLSTPPYKDIQTNINICLNMPILNPEDEDTESTSVESNRATDAVLEVKKEPSLARPSLSKTEKEPVHQENQDNLPLMSNKQQKSLLHKNVVVDKTMQIDLTRMAECISNVKKEIISMSELQVQANQNETQSLVPQLSMSHNEKIPFKNHISTTAYVKLTRMVEPIYTTEKENNSGEVLFASKIQTSQSSLHLASQPCMSTMQQMFPEYDNIFRKTLVVRLTRLNDQSVKMHKTRETNNNDVEKRTRGRPKKKVQYVIETVGKRGREQSKKAASVAVKPMPKGKRGRPKKESPVLVAVIKGRRRGRPKCVNALKRDEKLKTDHRINGIQVNHNLNEVHLKKYERNTQDQTFTVPQCDGFPYCPKFNLKAGFKGIPVKVNRLGLGKAEIDSSDDLTDDEAAQQPFECDNVIICQYEKVKRKKNRWKIDLKHGVMHLKGKDYVFKTATTKAVQW